MIQWEAWPFPSWWTQQGHRLWQPAGKTSEPSAYVECNVDLHSFLWAQLATGVLYTHSYPRIKYLELVLKAKDITYSVLTSCYPYEFQPSLLTLRYPQNFSSMHPASWTTNLIALLHTSWPEHVEHANHHLQVWMRSSINGTVLTG